MLDKWKHKEEWKLEGDKHCVVVSRHMNGARTEHHWCVYLYIYPGHQRFEQFNPYGDMWSQPHYDCHSYVSLFNIHKRNDGTIGSYQLGWDYNHSGDSYYNELATPDEAASVFYDAEQLFKDAEQ